MHIGKYSSLLLVPLFLIFLSGCEEDGGSGVSSLVGGETGGSYESYESGDGGESTGTTVLLISSTGDGNSSPEQSVSGSGGSTEGGTEPPVLSHMPEPGSFLLFGTGLLGPILSRSRKFKHLFRKKRKTIQ